MADQADSLMYWSSAQFWNHMLASSKLQAKEFDLVGLCATSQKVLTKFSALINISKTIAEHPNRASRGRLPTLLPSMYALTSSSNPASSSK